MDQPKKKSPLGGVAAVAEMLNHLDKDERQRLLANVAKRDEKLAERIQEQLFTFESLTELGDRCLQDLLREIPLPLLALALRSASEGLKSALLRNLSERAAKTVQEEICESSPRKLSDVKIAQAKIVEAAKNLIAIGRIKIL